MKEAIKLIEEEIEELVSLKDISIPQDRHQYDLAIKHLNFVIDKLNKPKE